MKPNRYFVSFVTEGPPHDNCLNLSSQIEKMKTFLSPYFKELFIFTPRTIRDIPGNENVCREYSEQSYFPYNQGGHNMGYWDWKPFVIKHVLSLIEENAILMYHDSNFDKYDYYTKLDWDNFEFLESLIEEYDIFLSQEISDWRDSPSAAMKHHTKQYTIKAILDNEAHVKIVNECPILASGRILMRNTDVIKQVIDSWHEYCQNKNFMFVEPNPDPDPTFKWGCADQSILNAVIYKYMLAKLLPSTTADVFFSQRVWKPSFKIIRSNHIKNFLCS